jgi:hypothetical protein
MVESIYLKIHKEVWIVCIIAEDFQDENALLPQQYVISRTISEVFILGHTTPRSEHGRRSKES